MGGGVGRGGGWVECLVGVGGMGAGFGRGGWDGCRVW